MYLNLDMVASPNAGYLVQGGEGRRSGRSGPDGSATVARVLVEQLAAAGVTAETTEFEGDSDYAMRFELTLLSVDGTNDGGASAVVSRNSARNHKLSTGPDGSGASVIAYDICAQEAGCRDYDDFIRPGVEVPIQEQQRYAVVVRQDGARWIFEVDGVQQNTAELENGPIERLSYYLYSFGKGTFHATVDNVEVAYAR